METKLVTKNEFWKEYNKLSDAEKIKVLYEALEYMQSYNGRSKSTCIAMAMGMYIKEEDDQYDEEE